MSFLETVPVLTEIHRIPKNPGNHHNYYYKNIPLSIFTHQTSDGTLCFTGFISLSTHKLFSNTRIRQFINYYRKKSYSEEEKEIEYDKKIEEDEDEDEKKVIVIDLDQKKTHKIDYTLGQNITYVKFYYFGFIVGIHSYHTEDFELSYHPTEKLFRSKEKLMQTLMMMVDHLVPTYEDVPPKLELLRLDLFPWKFE